MAEQYEPKKGDVVVLYFNKFSPENFEKGLAVVTEGFSAALDESGQTRRNFWLANPETHETIGISFFGESHPADEWHHDEHRLKVREQLEPLLEQPTVVKHYTVIGQHRTD
jgi:hypothetical protein